MDITIIIPTFNEAANIGCLIGFLQKHTDARIIVANSPETTDATTEIATSAGVEVLSCSVPGRAPQMNAGALNADTDLLYFVHADTLPPVSFVEDIRAAIENGYDLGYFRYRFDSDRPMLVVNSYCTRFDGVFAGGGDQTLFIKKEAFGQLDGFRNDLRLMEDFDLVKRARKAGMSHILIQKDAVVSARKYTANSWLKVNLVNLLVFFLFHCGVSTDRLCGMYRKLLSAE